MPTGTFGGTGGMPRPPVRSCASARGGSPSSSEIALICWISCCCNCGIWAWIASTCEAALATSSPVTRPFCWRIRTTSRIC